jgi:histidine triad (HIT) family protein
LSALEIVPASVRARLVKLLIVAAVLYFALHLSGISRFFLDDTEGIGALLAIVGTLYSVLYAFAIYVIWGQFTSVESQIVTEAGLLKDLLLFSNPLKPVTRDSIVRAVKTYGRLVVETEWRALSRGEDTEKTARALRATARNCQPGQHSSRREAGPEHQANPTDADAVCQPRRVSNLPAYLLLPFSQHISGRDCCRHYGDASVLRPLRCHRSRQSLRRHLECFAETLFRLDHEVPLAPPNRKPIPTRSFPRSLPDAILSAAMTDPNANCLFCRILRGEIPAKKVYEDDYVFAFEDIQPHAPTHVLVIPKKHLAGLKEAEAEDTELIGRCHLAAAHIARQRNIENGYRTVLNVGPGAGQSVFHLHVHLLGGRTLTWPPG